ncbi:MAG TPA: GntP family permease [Pirellulaceae bacterium]|jgi:H+/gluconate symporter-like permease|nr:GntP family permease [Pirellulaceae bacterium]
MPSSLRTSAAYGILGKALLAVVALSIVVGGWSALGQEEGAPPVGAAPGAGDSAEQAEPPQLELATGTDDDAETLADETTAWTLPIDDKVVYPLLVLAIGIAIVLGMIIGLKINAFIALIVAALAVSILAPGNVDVKVSRVAEAFGSHAGGIGIVIAFAAVIGECMLLSGAADRIVRAFTNAVGEKRAPIALLGSGYLLAVPVFFDTVFYLLVPLARTLYRRTGQRYLFYVLSIAIGGAITHTLVPPTPGPLLLASNLGFDVGYMILVGLAISAPTAVVTLAYASLLDRLMPTPMRQVEGRKDAEALPDAELPSLWLSLAPVVLPVLLISANTVCSTLADNEHRAALTAAGFVDVGAFRDEVTSSVAPSPGARIVEILSDPKLRPPAGAPTPQETLDLLRQPERLGAEETSRLAEGLNTYVLGNRSFHRGDEESSFRMVALGPAVRDLLKQNRTRMSVASVERLNRSILEAAYPDSMLRRHEWSSPMREAADWTGLFGNANLALFFSMVIALATAITKRKMARRDAAQMVETSLMSAGVIILITAAGGAFGNMLTLASVGSAIQGLFSIEEGAQLGLTFLLLGFGISSLLKIAQGSSTVAMITASSMLAGVASPETLGFHPVYLGIAIGAGSLVGSWMNDSGFWIFAKMSGLTEGEALRSWTTCLIVLGVTSFLLSVLGAWLAPLN